MATFSLGGLSAYTEENKADIVTKSILGARTMGLIDVRAGIKSAMKIPILDTTSNFQVGGSCAFNTSGTTTVTQTTITPVALKLNMSWCPSELEAYFTQKYLKAGALYTGTYDSQDGIDNLFFTAITDRVQAYINKQVEAMLWLGNTATTADPNLKLMNGFIKTIDTAATAVAATPVAAITLSTVRGIFEEIIFQKIPNAILNDNPVVFCSQEDYRLLLNKLWVDNLYHYIPTSGENAGLELTYPGSNVKVIAVPGLNSDNGTGLPTAAKHRIFAGTASNFVAGVDLENDIKTMDLWYSKDNREVRMVMDFKLGVANHFTDQIVQYKNI
jgi:hypothetical protein